MVKCAVVRFDAQVETSEFELPDCDPCKLNPNCAMKHKGAHRNAKVAKQLELASWAEGPEYFCLDSGAYYHSISIDDCTAEMQSRFHNLDVPVQLTTANGDSEAYQGLMLYVPALDLTLEFIVLVASSPALL
jgi:hypothetical protein